MTGADQDRRFRPDIDGLRAVAILLVIGRHIGLPGMGGGFVGVDIFFVISGYLITGLLVREQVGTGRIGLAAFYARRARRLLPALSIVIVATLALGLVVLMPDVQIALAKSALASIGFAANFHFYAIHQDYFAGSAALQPLQHLWSLAVEEQFYLLWPLLLALAAFAAPRLKTGLARTTFTALAILCVLSLALSIYLANRHPLAGFLMLPSRAWELGIGGMLTLAPAPSAPWGRVLAPIGLAAIALSMLAIGDTTPYPSFYALLPILGSVALLAAGRTAPGSLLIRGLGSRPLALLGKVSYGWYLWHWPLLALARNVWGAEPAFLRDSVIAAIALALAALSWRFVESPVRSLRVPLFSTTRGALLGGAASLVVCAILGTGLWSWALRPAPPGSILAQYRVARGGAARDFPFCDGRMQDRCVFGAAGDAPSILLWGDSYAAHLTAGLDLAARNARVRIIARTMGGCSPGGYPDASPDAITDNSGFWASCAAFNRAVMESVPSLKRRFHLRGVIIAGGWDATRTGWDRALASQSGELRRLGLRVLLVGEGPIQRPDWINCLLRHSTAACSVTRAETERQIAFAERSLTRIAAGRPDMRIWSPLDSLCPGGVCVAVHNGRLLYRNRTHLTIDGSRLLAPTLRPEILWLAQPIKP